MRRFFWLPCVLLFAAVPSGMAKKQDHEWNIGKILDENRARYFVGMLNNSSSQTTERGTWDGSTNSTSYGDTTNTQASGSYSGTSTTSTSGFSRPVYRVYDHLVVEGRDTVYITSERLWWRWSKGAHVAVNGTVKYYVDGRKLHLLDEDGKEHSAEIVKEVKRPEETPAASVAASHPVQPQTASAAAAQVSVEIDSTPPGADIEIDDAFVGNTPSTVSVAPGSHKITVKKKGLTDWTKTLNVTGGSVHLSAELDPESPKQ